eukprot:Skav200016  [mRNA]  locus=scaffold1611:39051:40025:+ [translate_table: standard]
MTSSRKNSSQQSVTQRLISRAITAQDGNGDDPGQGQGARKRSRSRRRKKKKKRKRSKKRSYAARGGGEPDGGGGGDSDDSSYSSSSEERHRGRTGESRSESESDTDMLPPLKRRASKREGSVLELLLQQVAEQMDAIGEDGGPGGTGLGGVKVLTYYNSLVRSGINALSRDGREMYLLAHVIDQLRMGALGKVGDALAGRFLALHQACIDQSWDAARNLELYTPELTSAAGSQVTLAARKHSRLMDRVTGQYEPRRYGGWGRSKGGSYWQGGEGSWETPGKKGGRGKGKGKKSNAWGKDKGKGKWGDQKNPTSKSEKQAEDPAK